MKQIPDDPIIRCIERTGYPPWFRDEIEYDDDDYYEEEDDTYYGNETDYF